MQIIFIKWPDCLASWCTNVKRGTAQKTWEENQTKIPWQSEENILRLLEKETIKPERDEEEERGPNRTMEGGKSEVEGFRNGGQWDRNAKILRFRTRAILFLQVQPVGFFPFFSFCLFFSSQRRYYHSIKWLRPVRDKPNPAMATDEYVPPNFNIKEVINYNWIWNRFKF